MSQVVVHQHDGEHGFSNWHGPQPHAWIVAASCGDVDWLAFKIDGTARDLDAGGRFERHMRDDVLTGGNATQHPARIVAQETSRGELVAMLAALLSRRARS